ncbi:MAG TPA: glycoside hydrolase family 18 protein [Jatrophihabitans sp.]|nr:glycoside hydrolase family 18 protein [Jatrophihabitans sp.]
MGFFEQWSIYGRGFSLAQADREGQIADLTDLDYAFGGVLPVQGAGSTPSAGNPVTCQSVDSWADWETPYVADVDGANPVAASGLAGNFQQLAELKAKYPKLRVIMSLGGYGGSRFFSDAAATPASRKAFVASCIDLFIKGNLPGLAPGSASGIFDGFDLDWEYPGNDNGAPGNHYSAADRANLPLLAAEFRRQLDALRHGHYRLTAELGVGLQNAKDLDIPALAASFDDLVLMDYDFQGPWNPQGPTNFESNLLTSPFAPNTSTEPRISVESSVRYFEQHGAPAGKLVIGIPYYGHGWTGVQPGPDYGLYQPATGPAPSPDLTEAGTVLPGLDGAAPSGTTSYYELAGQPGYQRHTDPFSGASWLYNPATTTFWSMQSPQQVYTKGIYINLRGLAGASVWALSDDSGNQLTSALTRGLHPLGR